MIGFKLTQGFLAGLGVAEVVAVECEAVDAPAFFSDLRSFAGEGDAAAGGALRVDPNAVFRVWAFAGEGEVVGVATALRPRCGVGEGDGVIVAVGLFAAAAFS